MKNDFEPTPERRFQFRADPMPQWDGVIDCTVLAIDPITTLSYTWSSMGYESVVHFTLTPAGDGTHVRMEQSGFRLDQEAAYKGAGYGWQRFFGRLESVLAGGAA